MARRLLVATGTLLVLLVLLEVGAKVWIERFAPLAKFKRYASIAQVQERAADPEHAGEDPRGTAFTRHRYLGFTATPGWRDGPNRHNELGFRGAEIVQPKPAGEIRIACIGGSTTYTTPVIDPALAYPAVLERELHARGHDRVTVINAGLHGWTTWESLINLQLRLLELEPDVIVVYHGFNDIKPRFVWPPELYRSDNSGYRAPSPAVFLPSFWEHSAVARMVMTELGSMRPHAELERTLDELTPNSRWFEFRAQLRGGRYPRRSFSEVGADEILDANPPIWFDRNLELLTRVAQQEGIEVVLATFALRLEAIAHSNPGGEHLARAMTEMNAVVADVAGRTGAHLFDFAPKMPLKPRYFSDHIHVTEAGAGLKGQLFAEYLATHVLGP